jgi:hypothetical protein
MEDSFFSAYSPTEPDAFEPAGEGGAESDTASEPGMVRGAVSLARRALSQVRSTAHRVQAEVERLVEGVRRRAPWSGAGLQSDAGRLLAKLEDRVIRLRREFQEIERIHHVLHVGTAPLQEVQDLQRRIADVERRLGQARSQATREE